MDATKVLDVTKLRAGDLLACYGSDKVSRVITWGTGSPLGPRRLRLGPSHVAIVAETPHGAPADVRTEPVLWFESTSLCGRACVLTGKNTSGVQAHRPADRLADYTGSGGRVDVYRPTPLNRLWIHESTMLSGLLVEAIERGTRYDMRGAVLSGLWQRSWIVLPVLSLFVTLRDQDLFCSEVTADLLMRIGLLGRGVSRRYSPATLFRRVVRQCTYQFAGECRNRLTLYREEARRAA